MFNRARWWSEKNKIKVVFKLQFHASQLTQTGGDGLIISVVPADAGKPTVKSDKSPVRDGSCLWENPVYETVKFNQDPKSGKIHERKYYFVVGTGSSKAGVVGEASIDFSSYAEATKASRVSLPLKHSKREALLHVSIQRIPEPTGHREIKGSENAKLYCKDHINRSGLGIIDEAIIRRNSVEVMPSNNAVSSMAESNVNHQVSCRSDFTVSSLESSFGIWEPQMKNVNICREQKSDAPIPIAEQHRTSWEWVGNTTGEGSTDGSSSTPRETFPKKLSQEDPDIVIEKLKSELAALSRQTETSELELQALRKQIMKENKRGQDLWREIVCLKEERDTLKGECEQFKASLGHLHEAKTINNLPFDAVDSQAMVKELRQELDHAKELNAHLRIQLQKTQDSNSELIVAARDLEEMLKQKNQDMPNLLSESLAKNMYMNSQGRGNTCQSDNDDEQKALEELVKEHKDADEAHLLEQQIMDLHSEIDIYKREKDELQMQLEQLALDYEIVKQENHDLSYRLEQCQIQEKLAAAHEYETQIENLERELEGRSKGYSDSLVTIDELEAHVMSLEEELDRQAQGFEADLEMLTRAKVEQEQRAIRAEETLKKLQQKNGDTAEWLQEEFRRLSLQMTFTFEANEKLVAKALAEANELRSQKNHLEEMLRRTSGEHQLLMNQIEQMKSEIEDKTVQLDYHKRHAEETMKVLSEKSLMLKEENEMHKAKIKILSEAKETLIYEVEQMRKSIKEKEMLVEKGNRAVLIHNEVKEKELMVGNLRSEVDFLQAQITGLKRSLLASELEKEKLRKQVSQLASDLKKRGDTFKHVDKKIKEGIGRGSLDIVKGNLKISKPLPHGPKDVTNLKERIKWLEGQIKSKETALETSVNSFLEKEKDLNDKISELETKIEVLNQSSACVCLNDAEKIRNKNTSAASSMTGYDASSHSNKNIDELKTKMALLQASNASMEIELRDMHQRYSQVSLKFAEVEGERQQLVMKLRNLANLNKNV